MECISSSDSLCFSVQLFRVDQKKIATEATIRMPNVIDRVNEMDKVSCCRARERAAAVATTIIFFVSVLLERYEMVVVCTSVRDVLGVVVSLYKGVDKMLSAF